MTEDHDKGPKVGLWFRLAPVVGGPAGHPLHHRGAPAEEPFAGTQSEERVLDAVDEERLESVEDAVAVVVGPDDDRVLVVQEVNLQLLDGVLQQLEDVGLGGREAGLLQHLNRRGHSRQRCGGGGRGEGGGRPTPS